jgi:hypothetical protein
VSDLFNIYCDESCHLQRDGIPVMVLGALWCKQERAGAIARRIRDIKEKHDLKPEFEIKWTKVSPAKVDFYVDLVDYFFDEDDLHFRCVIIPDKALLNHAAYGQDHDTWYYKMCFTLMEPLIDPQSGYHVYLDIKDTRSEIKRAKLEQVLRNWRHDAHGHIIRRVQQIRSHESDLMQMADLLLGAVCHHNRNLTGSRAKAEVIRRIQRRSNKSLTATTWLRESKVNILRWHAGGGPV